MAKKAISLIHSAKAEKPISLERADGKARRDRPQGKPGKPKTAKGSNALVPDGGEAPKKIKRQPKGDEAPMQKEGHGHKRKPDGTKGKGHIKRANKQTPFRLQKEARNAEPVWEALVYGALERDAKGHIIFTGQTVTMGEDGRWIKKGGAPRRKIALCVDIDQAWSQIPQDALVKALSDYGVFKDRFYKLSPFYASQVDKFPDEDWRAHALKYWTLMAYLHEAGLKLYHIFWVLAFMLDNGVSAREALIYWRQARITKACRRLYITPMRTRKVHHAWAKSIAWFESGQEPVGASEGKRYEQWIIQPRLKERVV